MISSHTTQKHAFSTRSISKACTDSADVRVVALPLAIFYVFVGVDGVCPTKVDEIFIIDASFLSDWYARPLGEGRRREGRGRGRGLKMYWVD